MSDADRAALERKSPEELEADIERTRARISEEVDALGYKLSPAGLRERAQGTLQETQDATFGMIEGIADGLIGRGDALGARAVDFIKRHPVPTTLLALGFAWLLMHSREDAEVR